MPSVKELKEEILSLTEKYTKTELNKLKKAELESLISILKEKEEDVNETNNEENVYGNMLYEELRKMARERGISNFSRMKKDELIESLIETDGKVLNDYEHIQFQDLLKLAKERGISMNRGIKKTEIVELLLQNDKEKGEVGTLEKEEIKKVEDKKLPKDITNEDIRKMKYNELRAYASSKKIKIPRNVKKEEMIDILTTEPIKVLKKTSKKQKEEEWDKEVEEINEKSSTSSEEEIISTNEEIEKVENPSELLTEEEKIDEVIPNVKITKEIYNKIIEYVSQDNFDELDVPKGITQQMVSELITNYDKYKSLYENDNTQLRI